jgi:hypothetical protein
MIQDMLELFVLSEIDAIDVYYQTMIWTCISVGHDVPGRIATLGIIEGEKSVSVCGCYVHS